MESQSQFDLSLVDLGFEYGDHLLGTSYTTNWDAMDAMMKVYAREGMKVADVTYGKGAFWKVHSTEGYDFCPSDARLNGYDFRNLPYEDDTFDIVVFDPPYRYTPKTNKATHHSDRYALEASLGLYRPQDVIDLYAQGIAECERVLRKGGFLFVKCQDTIEGNRQYWVHNEIMTMGNDLYCKDLIIVNPPSTVGSRWKKQKHMKKTHSYFVVFRKGGAWPFGMTHTERR